MWNDCEECKMRVKLSIQVYDQETIMDNEYPDDMVWKDVLSDIVKAVESSYGYSFDLEGLGIYYSGKEDE